MDKQMPLLGQVFQILAKQGYVTIQGGQNSLPCILAKQSPYKRISITRDGIAEIPDTGYFSRIDFRAFLSVNEGVTQGPKI